VTKDNMDRLTWLRKTLEDADIDLMREMLKVFAEELMGAVADALCGAPYGERSDERVNRRRAERALVAVIAECYVRGVSTRRVDGLVKTLDIEGISRSHVSRLAKSLDEEVAVFRSRPLDGGAYPYLWVDALPIRVREDGRVVKLVVSDSHKGLFAAVEALLPGAAWQRCRTHFMRNVLCRVPRSHQPFVATLVRTIFAQPGAEEVAA
jgi:transposase-like protein